VIDELEQASADAAIDGFGGADFYDGDPLGVFCAAAGFADGDALAGELTYFLARPDGRVGEESFSLDVALANFQHCFQAKRYSSCGQISKAKA